MVKQDLQGSGLKAAGAVKQKQRGAWRRAVALVMSALVCVALVGCGASGTDDTPAGAGKAPVELDKTVSAGSLFSFKVSSEWRQTVDSNGNDSWYLVEGSDGAKVFASLNMVTEPTASRSPHFYQGLIDALTAELSQYEGYKALAVPAAMAGYYCIAFSYDDTFEDFGRCTVYSLMLFDPNGQHMLAVRLPYNQVREHQEAVLQVLESVTPLDSLVSKAEIEGLCIAAPDTTGLTPGDAVAAIADASPNWQPSFTFGGKAVSDVEGYFDYTVAEQTPAAGTLIDPDAASEVITLALAETDASRARAEAEATAALAEKSRTFSSGVYIVGVDIEPGKYDIIRQSGSGNLFIGTSEGRGDIVNEILGAGDDIHINRYNNVLLANGNYIELNSGLTLYFEANPPKPAAAGPGSQSFSAGIYIVGEDIVAGTYDISLEGGSGNLFIGSSRGRADRLNEIFGPENRSFGIQHYSNQRLSDGNYIEVASTLVVRFDPK